MKLASLKHGRDGRLVVVSNDLHFYSDASLIAPTMQAALDDWAVCEPKLRALYQDLEHSFAPKERFHERDAHSPLPRAYLFADGSSYINHVKLVRQARGAVMPDTFYTGPLMYQGCGDGFMAPRDAIPLKDVAWGYDLEAEVCVITDDVPMGVTPEEAEKHIKLVCLLNDVSLRGLIPDELAKGIGFYQSKPASALSPVAVTPDALGEYWKNGKMNLPLHADIDDKPFGRAWAGEQMQFNFPQLIAHAAKSRSLCAGSIVGSGTVSNLDENGGPGRPVSDGGRGYSCIAEVRVVEQILYGAAKTEFLKPNQKVRIEMLDDKGHTIFGAIEQVLVQV